MRVLALLLLLAVLPTVELAEQIAHIVEHVVHAESPDHTAHHDGDEGDEHGCTGLIHLCGCHHSQVTAGMAVVVSRAVEAQGFVEVDVPPSLVNLTSPEPAQRPPIG